MVSQGMSSGRNSATSSDSGPEEKVKGAARRALGQRQGQQRQGRRCGMGQEFIRVARRAVWRGLGRQAAGERGAQGRERQGGQAEIGRPVSDRGRVGKGAGGSNPCTEETIGLASQRVARGGPCHGCAQDDRFGCQSVGPLCTEPLQRAVRFAQSPQLPAADSAAPAQRPEATPTCGESSWP